jgi:GNAT superfamily N-acetyltransferase
MAGGLVFTTPGRTAVALWLQDEGGLAPPPGGYDERLAEVTGPRASRFRAFEATLDRHHPRGIAHRHLAILAVRPDRQGRGSGTALLRWGHELLDRDGSPAYLEASSPRARDLYLAHGYVPQPGTPFCLPGGGPPMWAMWREPGARFPAAVHLADPERPVGSPADEERM